MRSLDRSFGLQQPAAPPRTELLHPPLSRPVAGPACLDPPAPSWPCLHWPASRWPDPARPDPSFHPRCRSFMSPEVFMHSSVSPALDVYSLGIIRAPVFRAGFGAALFVCSPLVLLVPVLLLLLLRLLLLRCAVPVQASPPNLATAAPPLPWPRSIHDVHWSRPLCRPDPCHDHSGKGAVLPLCWPPRPAWQRGCAFPAGGLVPPAMRPPAPGCPSCWLHADGAGGCPSPPLLPPQVRAIQHPEEARLPRMPDCPEPLQQLAWDCTHQERRSRPSAAAVVARLESMLRLL